MNQAALKKYIPKLPSNPGIYIFKDAKKYLYIGKASDLKIRLGSYLKTKDFRIKKMVGLSQTLKFISTQSDIEALILESQLIKKYRPQFNIVMRDDKQYFYVGFSNENFPKIFITHQTRTSGACPSSPRTGSVLLDLHATGVPTRATPRLFNTHFIGPFTDGGALKTTLRFLRSVFPYCTCKQLHHNRCLNYHIGKCLGFCCLKSGTSSKDKKAYADNINAVREILNGKKNSFVKELRKEAGNAAKKDDFEKAIELRDKIEKLERIFKNARIIRSSEIIKSYRSGLETLLKTRKPIVRIEGYDVSNIQGAHATGSMVTFVHGQPDKNFYRKFKIYTKQTPDDTAMLREILERRFRHEEWPFPDLILIDGGKGQVSAAVKTLKKLAIKIQIIGISKNERHMGHQLIVPGRKSASANSGGWRTVPLTKLPPADRNLLLAIDSEAHRFAIGYYRKLHRKYLR